MDDFFSDLARQVLGSQPEVGPLLPPRFAAWPDLSLASPPAPAPEPVDGPATAEAAPFPPPLVDPEHPAVDTPLPSLRQLSQVGSGPGPFIQPDLPPMPEETSESADAEPGDIRQDAATPLVPAADGSRPEPTTAMPPPDVGQTRQPLPAPPAQPVVQEEYSDAADAELGEPGRIADRPVIPLVHEPALEPPATPEPAPVLQRQGTPGAKIPVPPSPASTTPQTPLVAGQGETAAPLASVGDQATAAPENPLSGAGFWPGHDRPTMKRRADTAKGDKSPSTGPLQQVSPNQPGASSPGQAAPTGNQPLSTEGRPAAAHDPAAVVQESRRADIPLRPLVQSAPPGPEPVIQRQMAPGADLPAAVVTLSAAPSSAKGELSPPLLSPRVTSAPGAHSAAETLTDAEGAIRPLDQPRLPLEGQPGAAAGQGIIAPVETATVEQRPSGRIGHEASEDGLSLPGPAEPSIVPALESTLAEGRSPTRTGERAYSRRMPARPETGEPEPLPTIRVTIGRIEVRAAPPPPAPVLPRPKPVRHTLSLDEYLEATKGGEP